MVSHLTRTLDLQTSDRGENLAKAGILGFDTEESQANPVSKHNRTQFQEIIELLLAFQLVHGDAGVGGDQGVAGKVGHVFALEDLAHGHKDHRLGKSSRIPCS
jgi:hypothetical protein